MGLPGTLYASGLVEGWIAVGLTIGALANWLLVAPRLRAYTEVANNSITVPSFLDNRLHDTRRLLRWSSGLIILVYFTFYVSSGMVAGGRFFESSFGMDYRLGMVIVAAVTVVYTLIGGFLAVSYTDFIQGLMMVAALVMVPVVGVMHLGGVSNLVKAVSEVDPHYWAVWGPTTTLIGVISALAWGLGYFGQPHIIVRFMAIRSPKEAVAGGTIGIGWMLFAVLGAAGTAIVGVAVYQHDKSRLADPETVFITLGAAVMAWNPSKTILDLVAFAWAGFGASFGPTILLSLYWRRLSAMGAFAGMITGAVIVMIWGNVSGGPGGVFDLYEIVPGFLGNLVVAWAVSRTSLPSEEISEEFDAAVTASRA